MNVSPQNKFILIGAVAGAALGAVAALAYFKSQETGLFVTKRASSREVRVKAGVADLMKVGLAMAAIVRQIQGMAKPV